MGGPPRPEGDLHLSHWPGNRTPRQLRRDLSTEIAFAFLDLDGPARVALIGDCEALVLNHYDTDGVCAAFALTSPERARRHADLLHEIAAAGDLFEAPATAPLQRTRPSATSAPPSTPSRSTATLASSCCSRRPSRSSATCSRTRPPTRSCGGLTSSGTAPERRSSRTPGSTTSSTWTSACGPPDLGTPATPRSIPAATPSSATAGSIARSSSGRAPTEPPLASSSARAPSSTWPRAPAPPRPDLEALRGALQSREPEGAPEGCAWRCHDPRGASPELWFGREGLPLYAEHAADHLAPSRIDALEIKRLVIDAIRATWPLPDDDDEAEEGEDIFAV